MRKIFLISILIVVNCLLDSCTSNGRSCFNIDIMGIKNFTVDGYVELSAGDTSAVNDYAILLDADGLSETCMINYSFGGSLLAEDVFYELIDEVSQISIKSNSDLSANYPAGSELKNLFIPKSIYVDCLDNTSNISECLLDYFSELGINSLEEAYNSLMGESIYLGDGDDVQFFSLSTEEVIISNSHKFTIKFDFKNGASVEFQSDPIFLN